MSSPAPPKTRSSYVGCVSGVSFIHVADAAPHLPPGPSWTQPDDRMSSAFMRSLPQPPQIVSLPVPPTIQSLPRSPKRTSFPSLCASANVTQDWPLFESSTQPLIAGPSLSFQFKKYCWSTGGMPPSRHAWPLFVNVLHTLQTVPFGLKRIARRGSYSS